MPSGAAIGAAIGSTSCDCAAVILITTGDLAFSGQTIQYDTYNSLISTICLGIREHCPKLIPQHIAIPGNHDCDFTKSTGVREALLETVSPSRATDDSIIDVMTGIQAAFFSVIEPWTPQNGASRIVRTYATSIENTQIEFILLNTAWMSRLAEKPGTIFFPAHALPSSSSSAALRIGALHHPPSWFLAENKRVMNAYLEDNCDLVLTGHEHKMDAYAKTRTQEHSTNYIEGGVLHEHDGGESSFNLLKLDTTARSFQIFQFVRSGKIYRPPSDPPWQEIARGSRPSHGRLEFEEEWKAELEDIGMTLTHPNRPHLCLSDIYEPPFLRPSGRTKNTKSYRQDVTDYIDEHFRILVVGPDKSGKTAFARTLYQKLRDAGRVPILVSGSTINSATRQDKLEQLLAHATASQYGANTRDHIQQLPPTKKALIVDDYHLFRAQSDTKTQVLAPLTSQFGVVVLIASEEIRFHHLSDQLPPELSAFRELELLKFTPSLRSALIRRWCSMLEESSDSDERSKEAALVQLEKLIASVVSKGRIPSYPFYILMLLQQLRTGTPADAGASYGYLYESVITQALSSSRRQIGLDTLYSYLAEFANACHTRRAYAVSDAELTEWHALFCEKYHINPDLQALMGQLAEAGILLHRAGLTSFKYPYLYHFFVAKHLHSHITDTTIASRVRALAERLSDEHSSEIVLFLFHLSKNESIVEMVRAAAANVLRNVHPFEFAIDPEVVSGHPDPSPFERLPLGDTATQRQSILAVEDRIELSDASTEREWHVAAADASEAADDLIPETIVAYKAIRTLGQLLRSFPGSLQGVTKTSVARECYLLARRLLGATLDSANSGKVAIQSELASSLRKADSRLDAAEAERRARRSFRTFVEIATYVLVRHVSDSVALDSLARTYREVLCVDGCVANQLIDISVRLGSGQPFPEKEVKALSKALKREGFAYRVLQQIAWFHFFSFPEDFRMRQRICASLDMTDPAARRRLSA